MMKFAELISILQAHAKLHESLYKLAERKTEALKKNDIDALSTLMKDEQKHIFAIRQLEEQRIGWLKKTFPNETVTITRCLELADETEREQLRQWHGRLAEAITRLRQVNELNKQLLEQSLQFVTAMLDVMMPSAQPIAYNKANEYETPPNRSIFESKA
ncbi:flagellar protein FlgN [Saccharococcus thermophilus]|uniref:Flagellar biosynthesis/type III secretory pathway chaperone n=1 Tax=Saccharococcus thermophilus TaxID=29396 RepID=A0A846MBI6_9BACL|nr:flagellar protein FlgN [Saccharococcus thermophilus]NIK13932.1 flagellar biosynthesis/type III secretory pathway chaperone [Saccharococcus thermophilus]